VKWRRVAGRCDKATQANGQGKVFFELGDHGDTPVEVGLCVRCCLRLVQN
jgi:hypothetical protein